MNKEDAMGVVLGGAPFWKLIHVCVSWFQASALAHAAAGESRISSYPTQAGYERQEVPDLRLASADSQLRPVLSEALHQRKAELDPVVITIEVALASILFSTRRIHRIAYNPRNRKSPPSPLREMRLEITIHRRPVPGRARGM
jgi:hypothetical protein